MSDHTIDGAFDKEGLVKSLVSHCNAYKGGHTGRSVIQLATSFTLFIITCAAMLLCLKNDLVWPVVLLWLPAGGFLVRLFIIQHDCGHMSFFPTRKANDWTGRILSLFTVTPYAFWRDAHNMHHAASGNLDGRGVGSIDTLTVTEFNNLSPFKRACYRMYRNPLVVLVIGPPLHVMLLQRIPFKGLATFFEGYKSIPFRKAWRSILGLNLGLVVFYGGIASVIGFSNMLMIFLAPIMIAAWTGGWLFFIQHQFEDTYWEERKNWNFQEAAVLGSSYYKLHPVLQWFTGNIGLHHIHHLCSMIPNYKLQECLDNNPELQKMNVMTLGQSLRCIPLALWDDAKKAMITFRQHSHKA